MKKKLLLATLLVLVGALAFSADPKPYDGSVMQDIMGSNMTLVGSLNKAIRAEDWPAVAAAFHQFSLNAQKARQYAPPKGDAKEWGRIWDDFLFASWRGVGAAGEKDATKAKAALAALNGDQRTGHSQFQ